MSRPQRHNCLLTGYGAPRAPSDSRDPIPGLLRDWVQIFETPTYGVTCSGGLIEEDISCGLQECMHGDLPRTWQR